MSLARYDITDAYTLEELRREYQTSDAKGRIRLFRKLYRTGRAAPFEIALLAVEDPNVEVRQWVARHGKYFDYRERRYDENPVRYERPERNLEDRLKNDPDPFVRACLHENPTVFSGPAPWETLFREGSHLERLALVRNPELRFSGYGLIKKIFDPEDKELGITMDERKGLVFAFLTNKDSLDTAAWGAGLSGHPPQDDGLTWADSIVFLGKLWELASKWPMEIGIQRLVYRYAPAPDETKAHIYQTCNESWWRAAILENCDARDAQTIELGMKDADEICRYVAEQIQEEIDKKKPPKDPEELFGPEGRHGNFIEDKLDFIGKRLLSFEQGLSETLKTIKKTVEVCVILIVLAAGVLLLVRFFK